MKENILFGRGGSYTLGFLNHLPGIGMLMTLYIITNFKGHQAGNDYRVAMSFIFLAMCIYSYALAVFNYVVKTRDLFKEINNIPEDEALTFKHAQLDIKNTISLIVLYAFIVIGMAAVIILSVPAVDSYLKAVS